MRREIIYRNQSLYRDDFKVQGFVFGEGKKSMCVVGNTRGNEYQQIYACSQLVQELKKAESADLIGKGHEILVIPSVNPFSMNIGKRFWPIDNTDINRMFPGYTEGETTQRIAGAVFDKIKDYKYGVQFVSNYLSGRFMPCINIMKTGMEDAELAKGFGMPYIVLKNPKPYDTTTLNYNWQIWETRAYSLYTADTDTIDKPSAQRAVKAIMSFMAQQGIILYKWHPVFNSIIVDDSTMTIVRTPFAGLLETLVTVEEEVWEGQLLARIFNPVDGELIHELRAPAKGTVFFVHKGPMVYGHTTVFKLAPVE